MAHRAANLALVETRPPAVLMRGMEVYPRHRIVWGALAFCLSVWAVVILAVMSLA